MTATTQSQYARYATMPAVRILQEHLTREQVADYCHEIQAGREYRSSRFAAFDRGENLCRVENSYGTVYLVSASELTPITEGRGRGRVRRPSSPQDNPPDSPGRAARPDPVPGDSGRGLADWPNDPAPLGAWL